MYIGATGMVCAVGLDAASACAAMRAGISGFMELPYCDNSGEPIIGAAVPGIDFKLRREDRIIELLALAIDDLLKQTPDLKTPQVPLLVGLAEPERPGGCGGLADQVVARLQTRLSIQFHAQLSRAFPTGHTAGFEALKFAREQLQSANVPACIVCGADSLVNAKSLLWLDGHGRLKTLDNSDAVIPGEAGAAVLVRNKREPNSVGVRIQGLGFGIEKAHILSDEPNIGLGLAAATRQALTDAGCQMHEVDFRIADIAGEQYAFKELALVISRLQRQRRICQTVWHAAQSIGDHGAAAATVGLAIVRDAWVKNYAPGKRVVLSGSATGGARAAAIVNVE